MLEAGTLGGVETRFAHDGSAIIDGRFPYGERASFGAQRFETFEQGAFADSLRDGTRDVHFLWQHDLAKPLASRSGGSLTLRDGGDALAFEARISADLMKVGFVRDAVAAMQTTLVRGLSPGFRVTDPKGQRVVREGADTVRVISRAELVEISAVTVPAYRGGQVQARSWTPEATSASVHILARYRP